MRACTSPQRGPGFGRSKTRRGRDSRSSATPPWGGGNNSKPHKLFSRLYSYDCWPQARIAAFKRWLDERPEKIIVLVGHSTYIKELAHMATRLKNGELHTLHI